MKHACVKYENTVPFELYPSAVEQQMFASTMSYNQ
jgi:hypothetical protein